MVYESVAEIFEAMDGARQRLHARVEGLSREEEDFRPSSDAWSVAEIVEHLSLIEHQLLQLATMMLTKVESAGLVRAGGDLRIGPVSLDQFAARAAGEKFQAPESARPRGGVGVADSLAKMRRSREAFHDLRPRMEAVDLTGATYPHPFFGPLDLYHWLVMIGTHEDRHLRQIESVMQMPEFQARSGERSKEA